ncbi:hypothetical protein EJB05_33575, partial [Eragrostis curvula]
MAVVEFPYLIQCGVRGSLGPPCSAVGFVDRFLLGENHLYKDPVYKRTKECSINSPDDGPLPSNAPDWCSAPFDPEGMPFSKPLYTASYMLLTGGVSGFVLLLLYYIVDVVSIKKPFVLFQWMGMNALVVYILAACGLFPALIQRFYWRLPENNLVDMTEYVLQIVG